MVGEIIVEAVVYILGHLIVEIIFNKIIKPFFKFIGSLSRFLGSFGKVSFKTIYQKDGNTGLGVLVSLIFVFI